MILSSLYISNQPLTLTYFLIYEHITLNHELTQISIGGAPKDHNSAFSTSWMSLKCFASGVIFSVALIHLLGESLEVLSVNQDLLFPVHDEHEEEEHDEQHEKHD